VTRSVRKMTLGNGVLLTSLFVWLVSLVGSRLVADGDISKGVLWGGVFGFLNLALVIVLAFWTTRHPRKTGLYAYVSILPVRMGLLGLGLAWALSSVGAHPLGLILGLSPVAIAALIWGAAETARCCVGGSPGE
jgi:hypothetical protein